MARTVNNFLDYPMIAGRRLPHKALHNMAGVWMVRERFGPNAARYALRHLLEDELHHRLKMFLSRNGYRDTVKNALPVFIGDRRYNRKRRRR